MADKQIRRAPWHKYRLPGRYMISLGKKPGKDAFSEVVVKDPRLPLSPQNVYTRWGLIGKIIADKLYRISMLFPDFVVEQYPVMSDHVHFLLYVKNTLPEVLGLYIERFKIAITNSTGIANIFEDGFNDKIIKPKRSLDVVYNYIRENTYRLTVRRSFPDFFSRRNDIDIDGTPCCTYGNMQLLDNVFIEQVVVHRADSEATFADNSSNGYTPPTAGYSCHRSSAIAKKRLGVVPKMLTAGLYSSPTVRSGSAKSLPARTLSFAHRDDCSS